MAFIRETGTGARRRYIVNYRDEDAMTGRRKKFRVIDDAAEFMYQLEVSALDWRTADNAETVKRWTLQKLAWFWLGHQRDQLNRNKIRATSYDRYRYSLLSLPADLLDKYLNKITSRQLTERLDPHALNYIGAAFSYLTRVGMIAHNPVKKTKKQADRPWIIPDEETVIAMLEKAERREKIAIWLGAACALRISEVLALTYRDLSIDEIQVNKHLTTRGIARGRKRGKGRPIDMPIGLYECLDKTLLGSDTPVIAGRSGERLSLNYSTSGVMKRLLNEFGVARFHDLRHFAVSSLVKSGVDILDVSDMVGHSRPSVTLNVYGHLFREKPSLKNALRGGVRRI
ncbi:tyrosine-type recombinase/integrase [Lelliottia sp. JS-SCA-14]|uniref:tyrosine-type recombinase/integrase n=2 Tax=Lelliottia TaxID=1330545 RepID=UPI002D77C53C|nr:tyrosine-type recombinase/integrase [Lelliottia sp. JS-SCA-14]